MWGTGLEDEDEATITFSEGVAKIVIESKFKYYSACKGHYADSG